MKHLALCTLVTLIAGCGTTPRPSAPVRPRVTDWIRLNCWWVDDITLSNALSAFELAFLEGARAAAELNAFASSCAATAGPGWETDCFNCGTSLIDEVWR